jgi:hypothetical protein
LSFLRLVDWSELAYDGEENRRGRRLTASLAFLCLSSILALLSVPRTRPNMLLPRLRSGPAERSSRGRFFVVVVMLSIEAGAVGGSSCIWASLGSGCSTAGDLVLDKIVRC